MLETVQRTIENQESSSSGVTEHESAVKPAVSTTLARFVKGFAVALAVIAGVSAAPRPVAAGQSPADFISVIGADVLQEMRADVPLAQKEDYFRQMLRQDADLDGYLVLFSAPIGVSRARSSGRSSKSFLKITSFALTDPCWYNIAAARSG
jgi:hypothetical protein